jgi:hypothetical protein
VTHAGQERTALGMYAHARQPAMDALAPGPMTVLNVCTTPSRQLALVPAPAKQTGTLMLAVPFMMVSATVDVALALDLETVDVMPVRITRSGICSGSARVMRTMTGIVVRIILARAQTAVRHVTVLVMINVCHALIIQYMMRVSLAAKLRRDSLEPPVKSTAARVPRLAMVAGALMQKTALNVSLTVHGLPEHVRAIVDGT